MNKIITLILATLLSSLALANCEEQNQDIFNNHQSINAVKIPSLTYVVNKENCAKVEPTLTAIETIVPMLKILQGQYEVYYQTCDRSIDIIYAIEDVKINIILMGTLKELAESLAAQCGIRI